MRVCRKSKALGISSFVMLFCVTFVCHASGEFVKIKQAQFSVSDAKASLNVKLDFHLSPSAEEALYSGIALYWDVAVVFRQQYGFWYKTLFTHTYRYSLTYYTLLNNFRVKDEQQQAFRRFYSLAEALNYMQHFQTEEMPLSDHDKNQCVMTRLKVSFDREMLPAPLRPIAYFDKQWDLSSDERQWCE